MFYICIIMVQRVPACSSYLASDCVRALWLVQPGHAFQLVTVWPKVYGHPCALRQFIEHWFGRSNLLVTPVMSDECTGRGHAGSQVVHFMRAEWNDWIFITHLRQPKTPDCFVCVCACIWLLIYWLLLTCKGHFKKFNHILHVSAFLNISL